MGSFIPAFEEGADGLGRRLTAAAERHLVQAGPAEVCPCEPVTGPRELACLSFSSQTQ